MHSPTEALRNSLRRLIGHRYFVPFCLASGGLLRLLWICAVNTEPLGDFAWYDQLAANIANGQGYYVDGRPFAYWPIGYPAFLAALYYLFGHSLFIAKLANLALSLATILLTYLVCKSIFRSECAARTALGILSFSPNQIAYTDLLSTEILFAFLLILGAALFISARGRVRVIALSGAAWGLATLTKTQAVFVPVIVLFVFSTDLRSLIRHAAVIGSTLAVVVAPWMLRNYVLLGTASLDIHGGIALFIGNNPYADARGGWDNRANSMLGDLAADEYHLFDGREVERDVRAREVALRYMINNPQRTALLIPRKLLGLYLSDVDGIYHSMGTMLRNTSGKTLRALYAALRAAGQLYYVLTVMLFAISMPTILRGRIVEYKLGLFVLVYFTIVYVLFFGIARYHFSLMPWVAMYAGIGADQILRHGRTLVGTTASEPSR